MLTTIRNLPIFSRKSTNNYFNQNSLSNWFSEECSFEKPAVNINETNNSYNIEVAAPGIKKKDFNISVDNDILTISSENRDEKENKKRNFTRKEFSYSYFKRSFKLPHGIILEKIKAKHHNGVLKITIPKKEEVKKESIKKIVVS